MSEPMNETTEEAVEQRPEDVVDADEVATATEPVAEGDDAEDAADSDDDSDRPSRRARLEQEGEIAADYLEELLEIADLDGDLDMDVEGDRATVSIVGANLPQLVGDQGEVLEALQELTRLAVYRETGERSRLMLDISGYRADKRSQLERLAEETVEASEDIVDTDEVATATEPVDDADDSDDEDGDDDDDEEGDESDRPTRRARLEQEGEIAADYLE